MTKIYKTLRGLIVPAAILIIWHMLSTAGMFNAYIIPPPVEILEKAVLLYKKATLSKHVIASLSRVFAGFAAAFIPAFPTAVLVGMAKKLEDFEMFLCGYNEYVLKYLQKSCSFKL